MWLKIFTYGKIEVLRMYMSRTSLVYKTENPFVNLSVLAYNNVVDLDGNLSNLLLALINENLHVKYNLNEEFFIKKDSYNEQNIIKTNIFYLLTSLTNRLTPSEFTDFFDQIINAGVNPCLESFEWSKKDEDGEWTIEEMEVLNTANSSVIDSIFSCPQLPEPRNIYFLNKLFTILPFEEYERRIKHYHTYHRLVSLNKIQVLNLLHEQHIDINCLDEDFRTPLMNGKKLETIIVLDKNGANWFNKDVFGNDALTYFVKISDNEDRKVILNFAQSRVQELIANPLNSAYVIADNQHIENRLQKTLLELVSAVKPKKEIQDFIKKFKVPGIEGIKDDNGNNLAMIALRHNKWAHYELFQHCNALDKNKSGENVLSILFQKAPNAPNDYKILPILRSIFNAHPDIVDSNFVNFLLECSFTNIHRDPQLPKWLFKDTRAVALLFKSIGFNSSEIKEIENLVEDKSNDYKRQPEIEANKFYRVLMAMHDKIPNSIMPQPKNLISTILRKNLVKDSINNYSFQPDNLKKLEILFSVMRDSGNNQNYIYDFMDVFILEAINYLNDGYYNNREHNYNDMNADDYKIYCKKEFCSTITPLIEFFINNGATHILTELPIEMQQYEDWNTTIKATIQYAQLNSRMPKKSTGNKKYKI